MAEATYTAQVIDTTPYGPTESAPGFIEYVVRFTNNENSTDTFDARVQADGSMMDLQNEIRLYLLDRFKPAPQDNVPPASTFQFSVNGDVVLLP